MKHPVDELIRGVLPLSDHETDTFFYGTPLMKQPGLGLMNPALTYQGTQVL